MATAIWGKGVTSISGECFYLKISFDGSVSRSYLGIHLMARMNQPMHSWTTGDFAVDYAAARAYVENGRWCAVLSSALEEYLARQPRSDGQA